MLNQTIDLLFNSELFNVVLFFILIVIAYAICQIIGIKSFKSVIAFHALLTFIFVIIEIIDFLFIVFSIIEIVFLFKFKQNEGGIDESN